MRVGDKVRINSDRSSHDGLTGIIVDITGNGPTKAYSVELAGGRGIWTFYEGELEQI